MVLDRDCLGAMAWCSDKFFGDAPKIRMSRFPVPQYRNPRHPNTAQRKIRYHIDSDRPYGVDGAWSSP